MGFLSIPRSQTSGRFYIGSTDNLERHLSEHHRNHTPPTRGRGPWRLVYQEALPTMLEARRRELEIKRWKSAKLVRELVDSRKG
ncbi:MAG TPA: GIY-YIG nuclease family protein [Candidatus Acidoferrales bacterium]|nr:GIY-YIG nuclease family protein [Candidatus Acidoferrales bacterium]